MSARDSKAEHDSGHLTARGLLAQGLLSAAAQREAADCDRDGYDVTAEILRSLAGAADEAYERLQANDPLGAKLTLGWQR